MEQRLAGKQFDLAALRAEGHFGGLNAQAKSIPNVVVENRDVFEAALQAQTEILKRLHENTDTIIIEAHEETRSRIFKAIVELDTTSERRQATAQGGVERLHATMVQIREEIKEQNAGIERLRLERGREQSLGGQRAVQERLNAAYAALFKLAIVCCLADNGYGAATIL